MIVQNSGYNFNHKTRCQSDVGERLGTTEGQGQRSVESVLGRISPQIGKSILITCFGNQADALISDGVCALMWSLSMYTCNQSCICQVLAHVLGMFVSFSQSSAGADDSGTMVASVERTTPLLISHFLLTFLQKAGSLHVMYIVYRT